MDMNTAFDLGEATLTRRRRWSDLFHVVARYRRWSGCSGQANALKNDKPARKVVKRRVGCCYVIEAKLVKNRM